MERMETCGHEDGCDRGEHAGPVGDVDAQVVGGAQLVVGGT